MCAALQVKKASIMQQMRRPATAAEADSVCEEVTAIQAESARLDTLLAVRRILRTRMSMETPLCNLLVKNVFTGEDHVNPVLKHLQGLKRAMCCVLGVRQLRRKQFASLLYSLEALQMALAEEDADGDEAQRAPRPVQAETAA